MREGWWNVVLVTTAMLLAGSPVCADMMPMVRPTAGSPSISPCRRVDDRACVWSNSVCLTLADVNAIPIGSLPRIQVGATGVPDPRSPAILVDRQDSLSLCLYALLGFGVCRSAPWVRKLSLGGIPAWHRDGDPLWVGHRFAGSPDWFGSASVLACCFQAGSGDFDLPPQYHWDTITCHWRIHQFSPSVVAPRGPPCVT